MATGTPRDDDRSFLNHFPNARKSFVANAFLFAVRRGARTPLQVLAAVQHELRRANTWSSDERQARNQEVLDTIAEHHEEAMAFCRYALDYEALPPAEKERRKAEQGAPHRQAWMSQQPPTAKQCAYLEVLGYRGEITSRQHASELIEQLKRQPRHEVAR